MIKDNKKKIEDIERIEILLNNFLINQSINMSSKNIEKIQKQLYRIEDIERIKYKKNYEEQKDELIKNISFIHKFHNEIKNNDVRFFKILQEF